MAESIKSLFKPTKPKKYRVMQEILSVVVVGKDASVIGVIQMRVF